MLKRLLKNVRYFRFIDNFPEFKLGSFLVAILCTFLIVIATFTQLELRCFVMPQEAYIHPTDFFSNNVFLSNFLDKFYYIPQIPAVLFTGALLGPGLGLLAAIFYVMAGLLGCPIFASGGGIGYYSDPGFGYILGYFGGVYLVGSMLSHKITNMSLIKATIVGVLVIHLFGIIYMFSLLLLQHNSLFVILGWIWAKSGIQLPYDFIISFVTISLARPVRSILWVAMD
jgi:biotin transport system substrate-specific component